MKLGTGLIQISRLGVSLNFNSILWGEDAHDKTTWHLFRVDVVKSENNYILTFVLLPLMLNFTYRGNHG